MKPTLGIRSALPSSPWTLGEVAVRDSFFAFLRSFGYAFEGLWTMWQTQRNARVQLAILVMAIFGGWLLNLSASEWLAFAVISTLVLALEAMNTALEALVDLASPDIHPLAKRAKDTAAGAVLIAAIGAIVIAAIILSSRL